jgi:cytidylate kinase
VEATATGDISLLVYDLAVLCWNVPVPTVTLSASYGAHGDRIGHALAERLNLPFVDRAIPAAAARQLALLPADVAESFDERGPSLWERMISGFALADPLVGLSYGSGEAAQSPEQFRATSEARLREVADTTGAVVLGRAGMVVLGNRPDVLYVRLDGPVDARIAQVIAQGVDEKSARRGQQDVDRARDAYARAFFHVRQDDPRLYHIILDSTVLSVKACVDIIARAASDRFGNRVTSTG